MIHAPHVAGAGLLAAGVLMLYAEPLTAMVGQWNISPMYSYAFTVPLISLVLLWSRRRDFLARAPRPARLAGGAVIAAAIAMLVIGSVAAVQVVQQISFLVMLAGLMLYLFGGRYLRLSAPALAYLLFMVPMWEAFTEPLHLPFQHNSARLGVGMMQAAGLSVYREGTLIALPNVTLEVARACSGVNYLIAVLALALPLSILRLTSWTRRAILIAFALVISALGNALRVALIGVLAYYEIGSPLHGPFHVLHGLFVAALGYLALFGGLHVLADGEAAAEPAPAAEAHRPWWRLRDAVGLALVIWMIALTGTTPGSTPVALAMPLEQLPARLGAWQHTPLPVDALDGADGWREADVQFARRYSTLQGDEAAVYIWYFAAQRQSREIVNFRSADLHRAAAPRPIAGGAGPAFIANAVRRPGEVALFWYVLDGAPEAHPFAAKLRSLWTALSSGRSNGAAVVLRARASDATADDTLRRLENLAGEVHQALAPHFHLRASH